MTIGVIDADPAALASAAGMDLDTYSLARMIESEEGSGNYVHKMAVGECARNYAESRGESISELLLRGNKSSNGKYARQGTGKWASTYQEPTAISKKAAREVMSGSYIVGSATDFFSPAGQIVGTLQGGVGEIRKSADQYIKDNANKGLEWIGPTEGINARKLMCFTYVGGGADPNPALAFLTGTAIEPPEIQAADDAIQSFWDWLVAAIRRLFDRLQG